VTGVVDHNIQSFVFADNRLDSSVGRCLRCDIQFNRAQIDVVILANLLVSSTCGALRPVVSRMLAYSV